MRQFENEALIGRPIARGQMNRFIAEELKHWRAIMREVELNPR
jgi:hypothetical protein